MRHLIRGAVLSAMFCSVAVAANAGSIAFQNKLAACVTVDATRIVTEGNVVSASASFQLQKPIGECGCFSAQANYTSSVDLGGVREVLQEGVIAINNDGTKTLVLASEPALVANKEIQVQLTCAGPA